MTLSHALISFLHHHFLTALALSPSTCFVPPPPRVIHTLGGFRLISLVHHLSSGSSTWPSHWPVLSSTCLTEGHTSESFLQKTFSPLGFLDSLLSGHCSCLTATSQSQLASSLTLSDLLSTLLGPLLIPTHLSFNAASVSES